jgi:hypothetical protein
MQDKTVVIEVQAYVLFVWRVLFRPELLKNIVNTHCGSGPAAPPRAVQDRAPSVWTIITD